jgi:Flp pilus assembly protein TadG
VRRASSEARPGPRSGALERARPVRAENGQSIVEFALILPLLSLIVFGIIQFGLLFYTYIDLTSATREGARKAAVSRTANDGVQRAMNAIAASTSIVDDAETSVTVTPGQPWTSGQDVDVTVTYPYELNVMGIVLWDGPMVAEAVVRIE